MKTLTKIICLMFILLSVSKSYATLIENEHFIVYEDLEFTWASTVNMQYFYENELYAPNNGWRFFNDNDWDVFLRNFQWTDFVKADGGYVHSNHIWNSYVDYQDVEICYAAGVLDSYEICINPNLESIQFGNIKSEWTPVDINGDFLPGTDTYTYETFYVRDVQVQQSRSFAVSEPYFITLLAMIVLVFVYRKQHS